MLALVATMTTSGCLALPDVETKPTPDKSIVIRKDKVAPSLYEPFTYPLVESGFFWSIHDAVYATPSAMKLNIYWYYDFDPKPSLLVESWEICGGKSRCFVSICNLPNPTRKTHRLWAVVSSGNHKENAEQPFDFEDGVVFDAVTFEIETEDQCL